MSAILTIRFTVKLENSQKVKILNSVFCFHVFFILPELIYGGFSKSSFEFMQFLLPSIYFVFLRRNLVKFVNFATAFIPGHHLIQ